MTFLLFFFTGHVYTARGRNYLIPRDAAELNSNEDKMDFLDKALPVREVLDWVDRIGSNRVLFVLNACISDEDRSIWKEIVPDRRGITLGLADPTYQPQLIISDICSRSVAYDGPPPAFAQVFTDAIRGEGDRNRDGYITGTELEDYLVSRRHYPRPTSQFKAQSVTPDKGIVFVRPPPASLPITPAQLVVRSNVSGDTVYIDGHPVGPAGPTAHALSPGEYTVQVGKVGYASFETRITLADGEKAVVHA
uniref:PEGA domain-containing protein n=1 Tax=Candidatus Kentrum sp. TUN TaxID=2126343 RepID=A0A451A0V4_9GAMM|nr:MAG: PEGA domain-containing protein [Candidatus Kentron sp. TUN]